MTFFLLVLVLKIPSLIISQLLIPVLLRFQIPKISWIFRKKSLCSQYVLGRWSFLNAEEIAFQISCTRHGLYSLTCILYNVSTQSGVGKCAWSLLVS